MKVLGIVGSPRREKGLTAQVVAQALAGAQTVGARTDILYLADQSPEYCIACGHDCFGELDCAQEEEASLRSQRVDDADALVIGAPVYCWQVNGLTAALLDKVRLHTGPWTRGLMGGKPALAIAVAGGTGTGVFSALQSLTAWLCLWNRLGGLAFWELLLNIFLPGSPPFFKIPDLRTCQRIGLKPACH